MSETKAAAAAMAVASFPDVIISKILKRVPDLVSLFRCSLVCKEWRGLVSDPAFLRRRGIRPKPDGGEQSPSQPSLVGIFVQRDSLRDNFPTRPPTLVPAPGSDLGPQRRCLASFVRDDCILDGASPLAARDGLLLLRIWPRSTDSSALVHLCVCNLHTGSRDLLPALDANDEGAVYGYALLAAADHAGTHDVHIADSYSALFQVLLVGPGHSGHKVHVHRFSSASGDWDALDCRQTIYGVREPKLWGPYACRVAAVARGTAHWLFCGDARTFYTLDVSASTGHVSMSALPADTLAAISRAAAEETAWWLCTTAAGRLALLCVESNNRLVMIVEQRDDDGHHRRSDSGEVDVDVEPGFGDEPLSPLCIGGRSDTALALYDSDPERAYVLDLVSGSATRVEGWIRSFDYMTAVPCEINWEMFFVSRLGVKL